MDKLEKIIDFLETIAVETETGGELYMIQDWAVKAAGIAKSLKLESA